jgi:16S rRNA (uracil1498-N3)-methyltransferase
MAAPRIFSDEPVVPGPELALGAGAAAHVTRVLRLRAGDAITLFDGTGMDYPATLLAVGRQGARVSVAAGVAVERESPLRIELLQGVSRGAHMDTVIQKATELGVSSIRPVLAERSVVRLDEERSDSRLRHWQRVAISACEQCGRSRVPRVHEAATLAAALAAIPPAAVKLVLDPAGRADLAGLLQPGVPVALAIGPEGGYTPGEYEVLRAAGWHALSLGPRILRTETAPLAALSVLQFLAGDLRP